ncbi:hypothetical protein Tsubulata_025597, partial [Turnera subulata]
CCSILIGLSTNRGTTMKQRRNASASTPADLPEHGVEREETKPKKSRIFSSPKKVFALCLAFRIANSLLIQTYFNPDEHWQSLEVAHRIVFGYGHLTWEWKKGIRGYLHPLVFAVLYKVLALLGIDTPWFMLWFAVTDSKLSFMMIHLTIFQLFAQLANWFMFFCFNRTLSNSLETVLTLVSLYYWPCMRHSSSKVPWFSRKLGLALAALACAVRPTSAIIWIYVGLFELYLTASRLRFILAEVIPIGALVFGLSCLLDCLMYGSRVLVPLNFLKFNFLSSGGDYYGTHKWHWYFSQGFPVMLFTFLPFSIGGIIKSRRWKISGLIAWVLVIYSVLGHKEFRFVLPVLPLALMFAGYSMAVMARADSPVGKRKGSSNLYNKLPSKVGVAIFFLLATNIPMAMYMSMIHQRGTEDVMMYLSKESRNERVKSIFFLMPCHATPYYSTLHYNLPMRFLDCSPSEEKNIMDESDRFMSDPVGFASELATNWSRPSHIVIFDSEEKKLRDFLISHSFLEIRRFFHAHFKVDRDLQASVVVYALTE